MGPAPHPEPGVDSGWRPADDPAQRLVLRALRASALRWLAQREHSRAELARKLARQFRPGFLRDPHRATAAGARQTSAPHPEDNPPSPDADAALDSVAQTALDPATQRALIEWTLDTLTADGWLNDARVAESVLYRQSARYGQRRLRQTLQAKGLAAEQVASSLAQSRATELARATEVWRRRYGRPPGTAAERLKQVRFLTGRGFLGDTIRQVLAAAGAGASAEDHPHEVEHPDD